MTNDTYGKRMLDQRTKRGKELADRLNMQTVFDRMPKVYYVEDSFNGGYRVGRTDWPGDVFNIVPKAEFDTFKKVYDQLNMPLLDLTPRRRTWRAELWDKIKSPPMDCIAQIRRIENG